MYSFQTNAGRKKNKQLVRLLSVIIFILIVALAGLSISYVRNLGFSDATTSALTARVLSESSEAQTAVYRLTQSSGTNTATLLSTVRSHIYALQSFNAFAANVYGAGTMLVEADLLSVCIDTITQIEAHMQAGSVITSLTTQLRDQVDAVVAAVGGGI